MRSMVATPHDLNSSHLVLSQFSLPSRTTFADRRRCRRRRRLRWPGPAGTPTREHDPAQLVDTLAEHGLVLSELEGLPGWGATGAALDECRELEAGVYAVADATGARHVQVWGSYEGDRADAGAAFGAICDRAAEHGLLIALEFLPFTNVPDAPHRDGDRGAGRPPQRRPVRATCGTTQRGARSLDQLRAIPPECVVGVQLDDGAATPVNPDYYEDCIRNRVPLGEGAFDLVAFLQVLREIGADAPLAVEVLSESMQGRVGRRGGGGADGLGPARAARGLGRVTAAVGP